VDIALEKVCFIIVKAREFDAKVPVDDPESGSNPVDDASLDVLEDTVGDPTQEELADAIDGLNEDEQAELVALMWLGRGDYGADEWDDAVAAAAERHSDHTPGYLMSTPQLGDLLEEGLALLDYSCEDFERNRL
jgi:hypothetical protein